MTPEDLHKENVPLHPIVDTINSPTYKLEKYLDNRLKLLTGKTGSYIKDSMSWINKIKDEQLDDNNILVIFDVISLYTKIPINEMIDLWEHIKASGGLLKINVLYVHRIFFWTIRRRGYRLTPFSNSH